MELDHVQPAAAAVPRNNAAVPTSLPAPEPRRRVIVYSTGALPLSAWVCMTRPELLVQDVVDSLALAIGDVVALHRIGAKPVGEPSDVTSYILQQHGDLPPGSPDQLILLDVVFHQHGPAHSPVFPQELDRRVVRVPVGGVPSRPSVHCPCRALLCLALALYCQRRSCSVVCTAVGRPSLASWNVWSHPCPPAHRCRDGDVSYCLVH